MTPPLAAYKFTSCRLLVVPVTDSVVPAPVAVRLPPVEEKLDRNWLAPVETVRLPPDKANASSQMMLLTVRVPEAPLYVTTGSLPERLMTASSAAPGTTSPSQLNRSCHDVPSPPPSHRTAATDDNGDCDMLSQVFSCE
jgi:mRNA-degrading endonuclease toxin of MazEF toxin-antitoxin module